MNVGGLSEFRVFICRRRHCRLCVETGRRKQQRQSSLITLESVIISHSGTLQDTLIFRGDLTTLHDPHPKIWGVATIQPHDWRLWEETHVLPLADSDIWEERHRPTSFIILNAMRSRNGAVHKVRHASERESLRKCDTLWQRLCVTSHIFYYAHNNLTVHVCCDA